MATGTNGPDGLGTTLDDEVLDGLAGNDVLVSFNNGATLNGGPDNDALFVFGGDQNTLNGGDGNDSLMIFAGNNHVLNGDAGEDSLDGGVGDETLNGGDGNDQLFGDFGNDALNGDAGDDVVTGEAGDDTLNGGSGNDFLYGDDSGPPQVSDGADVLAGGEGNDTLDGGGGADVFKFSFTLSEEPGEAKTYRFTDWLSEKYGKDFGDELPDFEHDHHHHGKHHHHHGRHHHHHGKHDHHGHHHHGHHHHHHKHGGCEDHSEQQWGLSQSFFAKNYSEWLREVVVADLLEQGFDLDVNNNGKIGIRLNQNDSDGTPRIEGLTEEQLESIFSDRDEVLLRHGHHGHERWYSNTYKSSESESVTIVTSDDGDDTIVDFVFGEDNLEFSGLGSDFSLDQFREFFKVAEVEVVGNVSVSDMQISLVDDSWSVTLQDVGLKTDQEIYDASIFS